MCKDSWVLLSYHCMQTILVYLIYSTYMYCRRLLVPLKCQVFNQLQYGKPKWLHEKSVKVDFCRYLKKKRGGGKLGAKTRAHLCGNRIYAYASRLDQGQLPSNSAAGLRSNLFATWSIIPNKIQAEFKGFKKQTTI